jgi:hypothetical protein
MTLSIGTIWHYAQCGYGESFILFIIMLNVIMMSVVLLNIIMLDVFMLNVLHAKYHSAESY